MSLFLIICRVPTPLQFGTISLESFSNFQLFQLTGGKKPTDH